MKDFSELEIESDSDNLSGEKIKIKKIFNEPIIVKKFKIVKSKYEEKGNGKCLYLQIMHNGIERLLFTGSVALQESLQRIPEESFPFSAKIIEQNERFVFASAKS